MNTPCFVSAAENAWADRHEAEQDRRQAAEHFMEENFMDMVRKGDANAVADWAPSVTDWEAMRKQPRDLNKPIPKRQPVLSELMQEACEYKAVSMTEVMQLVLNINKGDLDLPTLQSQARSLLVKMSSEFARVNAEGQ